MTDIATLGIAVTSDAKGAAADLDKLAGSAGAAEGATESLAESAGRAAAAEGNLGSKASMASSAVNANTTAVKTNTAALHAQAAAARSVAGRQQQMMYQSNDIFMMLASGQAVHMIAIQQGSQLAQVYAGPGGLNNAFKDFTKLMGGVIRTMIRFAGPMAAGGLAVAGLVAIVQSLRHDTQEMDDAFKALDDTMEDSADVLQDTAEYALKIDLARIGRQADESVDPVHQFANELTGVAAALNDVTVARYINQVGDLMGQIEEARTQIELIEGLRMQERASPSDAFSATGPLQFYTNLTAEQEKQLANARIQLSALERRFQSMGGVLSEGESKDIFEAMISGDLTTAAEKYRDALKGTLEDSKDMTSELNKQQAALDRLASLAEKQRESTIKQRGDEIELINYRRDQEIQAINDAAAEAIRLGNNQANVEETRNQAIADARMAAEQAIANYRADQHDKTVSELERDVDRLLRDMERTISQRDRMAARGTDFDRSFVTSTPESELEWWRQDAMGEAQYIRDEELRLYQGNQEEQLRIKQEYLNRESEIERVAALERRRIREEQYANSTGLASNFFDALGQLSQNYTDGQSDAAETLFAISKGLNLAQVTMNAFTAYSTAWADPTQTYFQKVFTSVQAMTSVLTALASLRNVQLSGAREMGGPVYQGGTYLVGERGPELFTPGSSGQITSNANLQKAMGDSANDNSASGTLRLIVPEGWQVQMDEQARRLVQVERAAADAPERAAGAVARDIAQGGGTVSGVIESKYGLNRAAGA
ncbi:MAG: hypothetical protein GYB49_09545 [Alphaproteobacteria bacterium]|nr:hypothetical protein [Alphaproteobacteria bacterium]